MSGGNKIRAIGPEQAELDSESVQTDAAAEASNGDAAPEYAEDWEEDESPPARRFGWLLPALFLLAIAVWSGFFGWAYRAAFLAGVTPQDGIDLLVRWATPTLLVVAVWLLVARNSRREATRFGEVALSLRTESEALEQKLAVTNRELSLAREFLAAQSRELESLGRVAVERLSAHADRLQSLVHDNGDQVEAIASVSTTALENMGRLRDDLPVIANSARDVANQIGGAGRTAHGQIAELVSGFDRHNQFGQASERQVGSLQSRVDAAIAAFEVQLSQMEDLTGTRFDALRTASEAFRTELDSREVDALAALRRRSEALDQEIALARTGFEDAEQEALGSLRTRLAAMQQEARLVSSAVREGEEKAQSVWSGQIEALHQRLAAAIAEITGIDEAALASANRKLEALRHEAETVDRNIAERDGRMFAVIAQRQADIAKTETEALASLNQRLAALDAQLEERRTALIEQTEALGAQGQSVADRLWDLRTEMHAIAEAGQDTENRLAANIAALADKLTEGRTVLAGTDQTVAELTESSVRLLELIQAAAEHTRTELPPALLEAESRLAALGSGADRVKEQLGEAAAKGADLSSYVIAARDTNSAALEELAELQSGIGDRAAAEMDRIGQLRAAIAAATADSDNLAAKATGALRDAIALLENQAREAVGSIETASAGTVQQLAETIAARSQSAISHALAEGAEAALTELDRAATRASTAGREATVLLRDQLTRVNELASNLESRVSRARELAEEQVDRDFARRVALISEGLNSTAIDIAKILSTEVSDTAWTAYLRGDRGIFTRRAVRLLDNTEAREIAELFDADADFRDNVSRYIADFENMLRTLLSTRDGKAVSVTLLSSDMGKLYVALAQAIERLRT